LKITSNETCIGFVALVKKDAFVHRQEILMTENYKTVTETPGIDAAQEQLSSLIAPSETTIRAVPSAVAPPISSNPKSMP